MKLVKFQDLNADVRKILVTVVGEQLECDIKSGLQVSVNTAADPGEHLGDLNQELKICKFENREATRCEYECDCPVSGCQAGLLSWPQPHLTPWQICEVLADPIAGPYR